MFGASFADEIQAQTSISYEFDVTVAQRRQAETAIVTCVFDIADACLRRVEQRCDHLPHFGLRQAICPLIRVDLSLQPPHRLGKFGHPLELLLISSRSPSRPLGTSSFAERMCH